MDAEIISALDQGDPKLLVKSINQIYVNKNEFKNIKNCLQTHSSDLKPEFLVECIDCILTQYPSRADIANIILDGFQNCKSPPSDSAAALKTLFQLLETDRHRLAVKLSSVLHLTSSHVADTASKQRLISLITTPLMLSRKESPPVYPALQLILQFQLQDHFNMAGLLFSLTSQGSINQAAEMAKTLEYDIQTGLIDLCIQADYLKAGCQIVDHLDLRELYPTIHVEYKRHCMQKAVEKQLWSVASGLAEGDKDLQSDLVLAMITAGEGLLAKEFCSVMDLEESLFDFQACDLSEEEMRRRREKYLDIDVQCIGYVDSFESLSRYIHKLHLDTTATGARLEDNNGDNSNTTTIPAAVGLDVEWKPVQSRGSNGSGSLPSLLQLSTGDGVLVVDLLSLSSFETELDQVLQPILHDSSIYKVGVGITQDLSKLAAAFPSLKAFHVVNSVLDLSKFFKHQLVHSHGTSNSFITASGQFAATKINKYTATSLSKLSELVLGKPLDKSMQLSNWERRPLREAQLRYAALDALAAVNIFKRVGEMNPSAMTGDALKETAMTWKSSSSTHTADRISTEQQYQLGNVVNAQANSANKRLKGGPASPGRSSSLLLSRSSMMHCGRFYRPPWAPSQRFMLY